MSEQAAEMIGLLKSIDDSLKALVGRKGAVRSERGWSPNGDAGVKPCIGCTFARSCKSPCAAFDVWKSATGFTKARPGHVEKKS